MAQPPPRYSNCLVFAVSYRLRHRQSRIQWHRGRWWRLVPHFYIIDGDQVLDFKAWPARNGTPLLFRGKPRRRTWQALQHYLTTQ